MRAGSKKLGTVATLSALILCLSLVRVCPVAAQEAAQSDQSATELSLVDIFPEPHLIAPEVIAALTVDPYRLGINGLIQARIDLAGAQSQMADAVLRFAESSSAIARTSLIEVADIATYEESAVRAETAERNLMRFAIGSFSGSELRDLEKDIISGKLTPQRTLRQAVEDRVLSLRNQADSDLETATIALAATQAELQRQRRNLSAAETDLDVAKLQIEDAKKRVETLSPAAERKLASATDPKLRFSVIALNAYFNAEVVAAESDPNCGVQWWQLAGVGRVESIHGTHGGAVLKVSGRTTRRIIGPPLDGVEFLAIPDTDSGNLDGDLEWDRAVGPMQFIPGSWRIFSSDGDGDGVKDPHNIYDSTVAAAKHLCNSVRGITSGGQFRRALLGYNRSSEYGATVERFARRYGADIALVASDEPAPEQAAFCLPKSDQLQMLWSLGCRSMGSPARIT